LCQLAILWFINGYGFSFIYQGWCTCHGSHVGVRRCDRTWKWVTKF
jgi:hypothetical protein